MAFDIETATDVPGTDFNWQPYRPLGIACAAVLACDAQEATIWHGKNANGTPAERMSPEEVRSMVDDLVNIVAEGYTLLNWNGLRFDLDVLSEESSAFEECKDLALNHVDLMFHVFCDRGFPVKLDKAAQALRIPGKPAGMSGLLAPRLWAQGRYQDVIDYASQDVRITLQVAQACEQRRSFAWVTGKGAIREMNSCRRPESAVSWAAEQVELRSRP